MKKSNRKKISIFYFLVFMIMTSIILLVYISNIIYINELAVSNNNLKEEIKKNIQSNDQLRIEIEKLSSYERISMLATERFNISYRENSAGEDKNLIIKKSEFK